MLNNFIYLLNKNKLNKKSEKLENLINKFYNIKEFTEQSAIIYLLFKLSNGNF